MSAYIPPASPYVDLDPSTPIKAADLNAIVQALLAANNNAVVLTQVGNDYIPTQFKNDSSRPRIFVGTTNPLLVAGVTLAASDVWQQPGTGVTATAFAALSARVTALEQNISLLANRVTALESAGGTGGGGTGGGTGSVRGAATIGTASYSVPTTGTVLYVSKVGNDSNAGTDVNAPKQTIGAAITAAPNNSTIVVRAGIYHEQIRTGSTSTKVTVQPYPNEAVWMDGSSVFPSSSWTASGSYWVTSFTTVFRRLAHDVTGTQYKADNPLAGQQEQVFLDGVRMTQIADDLTPAAGQFSVHSYGGASQQIAIGTNPSGHEVRISDIKNAIIASQPLILRGIGFRRYSQDVIETDSTGFHSMVYFGGLSAGSILENVVIQQASNVGLSINKTDFQLTNCTVTDNGRCGIDGQLHDRLTLLRLSVTKNNRQGWQAGPATAGIKLTRNDQVLVDDCLIWNNAQAIGLWFDVSCTRFTARNCKIGCDDGGMLIGKGSTGLQVEEGDGGVYNGVQYRSYIVDCEIAGAKYGIRLMATGYVRVYNNYLHDNQVTHVYVWQDRGLNSGQPNNKTQAIVPWLCKGIEIVNNRFSDNASSGQILVYDDYKDASGTFVFNMSASDMVALVTGNAFAPTPPGSMAQWGKPGGTRTTYNTVSAFQTAVNSSWSNSQPASTPDNATGLALTAEIAAVIQQPTGVKHVGVF